MYSFDRSASFSNNYRTDRATLADKFFAPTEKGRNEITKLAGSVAWHQKHEIAAAGRKANRRSHNSEK